MLYNPNFLNSSINIPNDRQTLNSWYRGLYTLNPLVTNAIDFYAVYPARFLIIGEHESSQINSFFQEQIERVELNNVLLGLFREFWLIGECCTYAHLDEERKMWSDIKIQNPDYVIVQKPINGGESIIFLRPDEKLRSLVLKNDPSVVEKQTISILDKAVVEAIKCGDNIRLDNFYVSMFIKIASPYDVRGTSLLMPVLRNFMLLEKYMEENILPEEQSKLIQEIKTTLGHPDALSQRLVKEVIRHRITTFMEDTIVPWLQKKIFSPIAKMNDFYEYKDAQKKLIIPLIAFDSKAFQISLDNDSSSIFPST